MTEELKTHSYHLRHLALPSIPSDTVSGNPCSLSVRNFSTWYMINSTGSLSKIHFGVQDHGMVPYTRLLDGNIHRGLTSFPEVTFNLYFGLCKNRVDTSCNFMKNIESYSDHLVFLDGHHDTIHLVR